MIILLLLLNNNNNNNPKMQFRTELEKHNWFD